MHLTTVECNFQQIKNIVILVGRGAIVLTNDVDSHELAVDIALLNL